MVHYRVILCAVFALANVTTAEEVVTAVRRPAVNIIVRDGQLVLDTTSLVMHMPAVDEAQQRREMQVVEVRSSVAILFLLGITAKPTGMYLYLGVVFLRNDDH